jgi:site-specific recombinase XerC
VIFLHCSCAAFAVQKFVRESGGDIAGAHTDTAITTRSCRRDFIHPGGATLTSWRGEITLRRENRQVRSLLACPSCPRLFRKPFASRLVQAGVDLYTVKELLGHSEIAMTERYAHLAPDNLRVAVEKAMSERPGPSSSAP